MRTRMASLALVMAGLLGASQAHAADSYKVDPAHASVVFKVEHMETSYVYGRFDDVAGEFTLADDTSTFKLVVKSDSIDTNNEQRNKHLKGADFFDVKQFPTIEFKAEKVSVSGDDFKVTGDLTLHGVTKTIDIKLKKVGEKPGMDGKPRAGFETSFTIKRSDYGMGKLVPAAGDEVELMISFEGVKQ